MRPPDPFFHLNLNTFLAHQFSLSRFGLENYVLHAPRTSIISANKEGIASLIGSYISRPRLWYQLRRGGQATWLSNCWGCQQAPSSSPLLLTTSDGNNNHFPIDRPSAATALHHLRSHSDRTTRLLRFCSLTQSCGGPSLESQNCSPLERMFRDAWYVWSSTLCGRKCYSYVQDRPTCNTFCGSWRTIPALYWDTFC